MPSTDHGDQYLQAEFQRDTSSSSDWGWFPFALVCPPWDVALTNALLTATTIIYDKFPLAYHFLGKNACDIVGYMIGAMKVIGQLI
jgi:hypothetical protein